MASWQSGAFARLRVLKREEWEEREDSRRCWPVWLPALFPLKFEREESPRASPLVVLHNSRFTTLPNGVKVQAFVSAGYISFFCFAPLVIFSNPAGIRQSSHYSARVKTAGSFL